jgi:hypothetical protein
VDRGTYNHEPQGRTCRIFLHRHHPSVRSAELQHHRQRLPIHGQTIPGILRQTPHPQTNG